MEKKVQVKKIDFLQITQNEQEEVLKKALQKGQAEQKKLEREYEKLLTYGTAARA